MNSNGGSSFFGSDWLGAFLIIAILFGGGFGFGGGRPVEPDIATKSFVQESINNQALQNGQRDILLSSANNNYEMAQRINDQTNALMQQGYVYQLGAEQRFNALQAQISQLGYQMDQCCCSLKTQMLQDKYDALEEKYRSAQNDLSNAAQSQYILAALGRYVTNPPVAAATT